ncbi:shikimate kinase [Cellulosilyticum ruminicola]|uniref:shikimate kinase n=1 Tax=Cellulosilyticum ruminicola TaxID=425254 RepID=UPI0006D16C48|nr:shikimate kinase [Cellulosilyticum ruminicola]
MGETICLIGFMGSGKTTVGEALAKKMGWNWVDLDAEIVKGEKNSIANIFAEKGEGYFRRLETQYLSKVLEEPKTIISTGGGVVVTPENIEMLVKNNTVYLNWEFDTLYERIASDKARPLVTSYEEVHARYKSRQVLYEAASKIRILCENKSVIQLVDEILEHIKIV